MIRALSVGALIAVLVLAVAAVLVATGVVTVSDGPEAPEELLVIALAPEEGDTDVAAYAFVLERESGTGALLDTGREVTVSGTTARTARDAYPFGGGEAVAEALSPQTSGRSLDWVVLPEGDWVEMVESAGGIEVDIPEDVSAYRAGQLVMLERGRRKLSGPEVVALISALPFIEDEEAREVVSQQVSAGISAAVALAAERLPAVVVEGPAESSVSREVLRDFVAGERGL